MRIRVIPSELHALAALWQQAAQGLEQVNLQVQRAWSNLDWEVRQEAALEALVIQARRQALALQEEAQRLARFLEERATAFEQADQEGITRLSQVTGAWMAASGRWTASQSLSALSFPANRARSVLSLGSLLGPVPAPRWELLRLEPEEGRALVDFGADLVLSKVEHLGLLKDLLDTARIPSWQRQVDEALRAWEMARRQFGAGSPQAQAAYGRYLEELIFRMPILGTGAQALLTILKIVGRMHPVE
ncbi:MAG: hypothetical protein ACP5ME_13700 [Anaerolineae bacterium]